MTQRIMGEEPRRSDYADAQPSRFPFPQNHHTTHAPHHPYNHINRDLVNHSNGTAPLVNGEEEPYTIKCICGFQDDDGNTVLCEQCNTWQHIECYYFPTLAVPEVHKCADCWPRVLDSSGAAQRQQRLREPLAATEDKRKRSAPKTSRRPKVKEVGQLTTQINGYSGADGFAHDRKSASPRDQPPPAKRPKTTHKPSNSINTNSHSRPFGHRNRSGSNLQSKSAPVKPPLSECPPDYLSPDFIQIHRTNTDFTESPANLHLNIGVSNLLSTWLDDPDAFAAATNGRTHEEVFKHFPQPIEELETPIKKNIYEDDTATFHGHHPIWPFLSVEKDLNEGDFVGELRGSIGHRDDYKADPTNRWEKLRHPDHFVFFHPYLPIYIDCRNEGSLLRYARRSCQPNLKLETIITGDREYRFVFTALTDLPNGTEITVPWDTQYDRQLQDCLSRNQTSAPMNESEKAYVQEWVETILAHFGGCACVHKVCPMAHFDHRLGDNSAELLTKASKTAKRKRAIKKSPPNNSRATNSRAGSEAVHADQDVDMDDDRSTSPSARTGTSREGTPSSRHHGVDSKGNELSERDKRKLIQQERLFDKMENEQGTRKKKRNSGSNANTPGAIGTKSGPRRTSNSIPNTPGPAGRPRMVDAGTYFGSGGAQSPGDNSPRGYSPTQTHARRQNPVSAPPLARPEYADANTQTDPEVDPSAGQPSPPARVPHTSLSQRLLRRSRLHMVQNAADSLETTFDHGQDRTNASQPDAAPHDLPEPIPDSVPQQEESRDTEMKDADSPEIKPQEAVSLQQTVHTSGVTHDSGAEPVPQDALEKSPPAAAAVLESNNETLPPPHEPRNNFRSTNLHVDLPPPPIPSSASINSPLANTPGPLSNSSEQSPVQSGHLAPTQTPGGGPVLPHLARPSPVKKMSLSDYMNKRKTPATEKTLGQSLQGSGSTPGALASPMKTLVDGEPVPKESPPGSATLMDVKQEESGESRPA